MQTYPVEIDAEQIVRWIMAEQQGVPSTFRISARLSTEPRAISVRREYHLGDEEREDLTEVATVATLEIAPAHASDGWILTVVVEDELGPRVPDRGRVLENDQPIDLGTFYREFIRPGRGSATAVAEVEGPAARANLTRLLQAIERNAHPRIDARQ
jgi:hypothetical protein